MMTRRIRPDECGAVMGGGIGRICDGDDGQTLGVTVYGTIWCRRDKVGGSLDELFHRRTCVCTTGADQTEDAGRIRSDSSVPTVVRLPRYLFVCPLAKGCGDCLPARQTWTKGMHVCLYPNNTMCEVTGVEMRYRLDDWIGHSGGRV